MARILVTGRDGQVARSLASPLLVPELHGHQVMFAARPEFDLADARSIERTIDRTQPDIIFSAAAYTDVERAEEEPELAMAINARAPGVIGHCAYRIGARVIHLSTDYVFSGEGTRPWREEDPVGPVNTYGESKLAGEQLLAASGADHCILRTSWLHSPFGKNFVKTILGLATERGEVSVVDDQFGNPTSAVDVARALLTITRQWDMAARRGSNRTYHLAGQTAFSRAEFAVAILRQSRQLGGPTCAVNPICSIAYPSRARRPGNSRMDSSLFLDTFGYSPRDFDTALGETVAASLGLVSRQDQSR